MSTSWWFKSRSGSVPAGRQRQHGEDGSCEPGIDGGRGDDGDDGNNVLLSPHPGPGTRDDGSVEEDDGGGGGEVLTLTPPTPSQPRSLAVSAKRMHQRSRRGWIQMKRSKQRRIAGGGGGGGIGGAGGRRRGGTAGGGAVTDDDGVRRGLVGAMNESSSNGEGDGDGDGDDDGSEDPPGVDGGRHRDGGDTEESFEYMDDEDEREGWSGSENGGESGHLPPPAPLPPFHSSTPTAEQKRYYWELCYGSNAGPRPDTPGGWSASRAPPTKSILSARKAPLPRSIGNSPSPRDPVSSDGTARHGEGISPPAAQVIASTTMVAARGGRTVRLLHHHAPTTTSDRHPGVAPFSAADPHGGETPPTAPSLRDRGTASDHPPASHGSTLSMRTPSTGGCFGGGGSKSVKFGDVAAAEFDLERPTVELTPIASDVAREKYSLEEKRATVEDEELSRDTVENGSILATWDEFDDELDFDDDGDGDDFLSPAAASPSSSSSSHPRDGMSSSKRRKKNRRRHSSGRDRRRGGRRESGIFSSGSRRRSLIEEEEEDEDTDGGTGAHHHSQLDSIGGVDEDQTHTYEGGSRHGEGPAATEIPQKSPMARDVAVSLFDRGTSPSVGSVEGHSPLVVSISGASSGTPFRSPLVGGKENDHNVSNVPDSLYNVNSSGALSSPGSFAASGCDTSMDGDLSIRDVKKALEKNLASATTTDTSSGGGPGGGIGPSPIVRPEQQFPPTEQDERCADRLLVDSGTDLRRDIDALLTNAAGRTSITQAARRDLLFDELFEMSRASQRESLHDLMLTEKQMEQGERGIAASASSVEFLDVLGVACKALPLSLTADIGCCLLNDAISKVESECGGESSFQPGRDRRLYQGKSFAIPTSSMSPQSWEEQSNALPESPLSRGKVQLCRAVGRDVSIQWIQWERKLAHVLLTRLATLNEECTELLSTCDESLRQIETIVTGALEKAHPTIDEKRQRAKRGMVRRKAKRLEEMRSKEEERIEELERLIALAATDLMLLKREEALEKQLIALRSEAIRCVQSQERCDIVSNILSFTVHTLSSDNIELVFPLIDGSQITMSYTKRSHEGDEMSCSDQNESFCSDASGAWVGHALQFDEVVPSVSTQDSLSEESATTAFIKLMLPRDDHQSDHDRGGCHWTEIVSLSGERYRLRLVDAMLTASDFFNRVNMVALDINSVIESDLLCEVIGTSDMVAQCDPERRERAEVRVEIPANCCALRLRFVYDISKCQTVPCEVLLEVVNGEPPVDLEALKDVAASFTCGGSSCNAFVVKRTCDAILEACGIGVV